MAETIDLNRCRRAMRQIDVTGAPRAAVIEEAIAAIQTNPSSALVKNYLGVKNYASFGDQREDHQYGYGPKHGTIVFRIGRTAEAQKPGSVLDVEDIAYYLEAYRDFTPIEDPRPADSRSQYHGKRLLTLGMAIRAYDDLAHQTEQLRIGLHRAVVESHIQTVGAK